MRIQTFPIVWCLGAIEEQQKCWAWRVQVGFIWYLDNWTSYDIWIIKLHIIFRWLTIWWLWRSRIEGYTSGDQVKPGNPDSIIHNSFEMTFWASKHIPHLMIFKDIFHNPHTQYIPVSNDILSTKIFSTYFKQGNSTKLPLSCLSFSSKIQCGQLLGLGNILIIDTTHITIIVIIVTITLADHSDQSKYSVNRLNWTKSQQTLLFRKETIAKTDLCYQIWLRDDCQSLRKRCREPQRIKQG